MLYSLLYLVPFAMAFLCLTIKRSWIRSLNLVGGVSFGVVMLLDLVWHGLNLARGGHESAAVWLIMATGLVGAALIVGLSRRRNYRDRAADASK